MFAFRKLIVPQAQAYRGQNLCRIIRRSSLHPYRCGLSHIIAPKRAATALVRHKLNVCYWHEAEIPPAPTIVRYRGKADMTRTAVMSVSDPKRTCRAPKPLWVRLSSSEIKIPVVLFERLRSPIVCLECADFPVAGDVHDTKNIGAVVQGISRRDARSVASW